MEYNCISHDTPLFVIEDKLNLTRTIDEKDAYEYAKKIHEETNVPISCLYKSNNGLFYLDCWHKVNNIWYYFKSDLDEISFINELLGEKISEYFHLDTIHYEIAKLNNGNCIKIGLASPNFSTFDSTYKTIFEYPQIWDNKGLSILKNIRKILINEKQFDDLSLDIKKLFVRDFLVGETDRCFRNFLFRENKTEIRLAPLYDYESSFTREPDGWYVNSLGLIDVKNQEITKKNNRR